MVDELRDTVACDEGGSADDELVPIISGSAKPVLDAQVPNYRQISGCIDALINAQMQCTNELCCFKATSGVRV